MVLLSVSISPVADNMDEGINIQVIFVNNMDADFDSHTLHQLQIYFSFALVSPSSNSDADTMSL